MDLEILLKILSGDTELANKYTQEQIEQELNTHQRLLTKKESRILHEKLKLLWDVNGYWYPLKSNPPKNLESLFLKDSAFDLYKAKLRDKLKANDIQKIFEIREGGEFENEYELNVEIFEPYYGGSEGFWFDKGMEWLIYVSHEDSITFAGNFIVSIIREIFPAYKKHLWN